MRKLSRTSWQAFSKWGGNFSDIGNINIIIVEDKIKLKKHTHC